MSICYVETWIATAPRDVGWQCFTCRDEQGGFTSLEDAEKAAEHHRVEAATQQLIDDGELP